MEQAAKGLLAQKRPWITADPERLSVIEDAVDANADLIHQQATTFSYDSSHRGSPPDILRNICELQYLCALAVDTALSRDVNSKGYLALGGGISHGGGTGGGD